ncbi:MAG: protein kinase domain-containing protein, partial [Thermoanaerobaculia bacterium]
MTRAGSMLGTAAYMSPEQARGRAVDKRADIWAFGVILFEMLTGRQLFAGETVSDTIAAVLTREPDFAALPAAVPAHVRALIARCLERDPKRRLRDIGEARHQLEQTVPASASGTGSAAAPAQPSGPVVPPRRRRLAWLAAAVGVALVASLALLWKMRQPRTIETPAIVSKTSAPSIAVLPFVNASGTADDEYFSDGITDELASALMKVPGLRVAARSSAFTFKGKAADAREVGAKLSVATVLEGTVRRSGSKLRVTVQLVNAADGLALWSERYEREAKDVFAVQDDITGAIVGALRLALGSGPPGGSKAGHTENAEAHDLYLRGRFLMFKQTEDSLRKSLDYFAQALAKDPNYAPAYAGEAFAWAWLADLILPPREAEPKAKAAALKALELDPTNVEARSVLAAILSFYDWDPAASEEEFRRALQVNPSSMDAHNLYALTLCASKRWDDGLAETQRAIALDPLSAFPSWTREMCLCLARRYDEVIAQHRKTEELDSNFYYLDSWAGIAYREKGMYAEAVAEYQHVQKVTGSPVAGLAVTYAQMGRTAEARTILQEFLELAKRRYVSPDQMAMIYANLGEKDQAFAWLDKAYEARSGMGVLLISASYDPLRADPRFTALLRKMGLEK